MPTQPSDEHFEPLEDPPQWLDAGEVSHFIQNVACPMWRSGCRWTTCWWDDDEVDLEEARRAYREHWRDEH